MDIKILGPGCRNCQRLAANVADSVSALGLEATVTKVTEWPEIMSYGIMGAPGLVIDGVVVLSGRVPTAAEVRQLLTAHRS